MSDELSPDARRLVDAARAGDAARPGAKARVKARLVAELGAAAFTTTALAAGDPLLAGGESADGMLANGANKLWLKLAKLATVAGTAGALYAGVAYVGRPAPRPVESTPPATDARPALPSPPSDAPPDAVDVPMSPDSVQETGPVEAESAESAVDEPKRVRPHRRASSRTTAATGDEGSLAAELALLERAQRALREGRPDQALALSREHRATFPKGALIEERSGIEAIARCMRGEGADAARAFLARAPGSPLAGRVRKECGEP